MAVTLTDSLQARWQVYLATESSGTRDAKIHALSDFVGELVSSPAATWKESPIGETISPGAPHWPFSAAILLSQMNSLRPAIEQKAPG